MPSNMVVVQRRPGLWKNYWLSWLVPRERSGLNFSKKSTSKNTLLSPEPSDASATGTALNYLHNEWDQLIRYLDDGRLEIDNNLAENAIRPFVTGRKNWLFSVSVKGVKASTNLYSLIECAKINGLEPQIKAG